MAGQYKSSPPIRSAFAEVDTDCRPKIIHAEVIQVSRKILDLRDDDLLADEGSGVQALGKGA